jgi:hypothetical protein
MANSPAIYSRGYFLIGGLPYRECQGAILNFSYTINVNDQIIQGNSCDGSATGVSRGNYQGTISFTEVFPSNADYINFNAIILTTPELQITFVPTSIQGDDEPPAPQITFGKLARNTDGGSFNIQSGGTVERNVVIGFGWCSAV